ncbi:cell division protein FtsL [Gammaproteobacteria bacterium AS21]
MKAKVEHGDIEQPRVTKLLNSNQIGRPILVVVVLFIAILMTSILVIFQSYQYRQLFNTEQQLVAQWDELQVEWGQLLLEQSTLGENSRVESLAKRKLGMLVPHSENVEMISYE